VKDVELLIPIDNNVSYKLITARILKFIFKIIVNVGFLKCVLYLDLLLKSILNTTKSLLSSKLEAMV